MAPPTMIISKEDTMSAAHTLMSNSSPSAPPNRRQRWLLVSLLALLLVPSSGCNVVLLLGYLIGGPPSIEPDFDKQVGKSLKGKKHRILVLCYAPTELKWDNDAVDREVARHVAYRLNMNNIKVIDPDKVNAWLDKNPNWDKPSEVGDVFNATHVVYIDMKTFGLFEEHSSHLYRGRSDCIVTVVEMEKSDGKQIFSKEVTSKFPGDVPVSADQFSFKDFKKLYLSRLSDQIGQLFYERYAGDDMPHAVLH